MHIQAGRWRSAGVLGKIEVKVPLVLAWTIVLEPIMPEERRAPCVTDGYDRIITPFPFRGLSYPAGNVRTVEHLMEELLGVHSR
jgi:hypothetical protein